MKVVAEPCWRGTIACWTSRFRGGSLWPSLKGSGMSIENFKELNFLSGSSNKWSSSSGFNGKTLFIINKALLQIITLKSLNFLHFSFDLLRILPKKLI